MSAIAFISHFQVRPDGLAGYRRLAAVVAQRLAVAKAGTVGFLHYVDPQTSRLTIVHVFADAAAMDAHFVGAEARSDAAYRFITPVAWEIYGPASDAAVASIREAATQANVEFTMSAEYVAGYLRSENT